jgi:hypothetical protein
MKLTGTVVFHPSNGQHYFSPGLWNDATYAVGHSLSGWRTITRQEQDALRATDALPQWPGENALVVDNKLATFREVEQVLYPVAEAAD